MRIRFALLILLVALSCSARELSQDPVGRNLAQRLKSAQGLMHSRPDLALQLLEQLNLEYPGQDHLRFELARAHMRMENYEVAETLLRDLLARSPLSVGIGSELARLLLRSGREDEGRRLAEETYLSGQVRAEAFRSLASFYRSVDRHALAEEAYLLGLARLPVENEPGRVHLMEGLIIELSLSGRVDDVLLAFADWPEDYARHAPTRSLIRRAEKLMREQDNLDSYTEFADSLSSSPEGIKLSPLLREIYFATHNWDAYLREVQRSYSSHPNLRRSWMQDEAQRCEAWPDPARQIWETVLAEGPESSEGRQARLALLELDLQDDAQARFRGEAGKLSLPADLDRLSREDWGAESNLEIFLTHQDFLRRRLAEPEAATAAARESLMHPYTWFPRAEIWRLEIELGLNLLALGHDDEARGLFTGLLEAYRPKDEDAQLGVIINRKRRRARDQAYLAARYQLARIDILQGDLSAAQDSLAALALEHPDSREANDALEAALLLAEAASWPESLAKLLRGSLELEIRQRPGEAANRLAVFADQFSEDESMPTILFRMGILYEQAFRSAEALEAWERLGADFPDHHRAASALEHAARLALHIGDLERARRLVDRLLDEHPESTQIPGLRELREQLTEDA